MAGYTPEQHRRDAALTGVWLVVADTPARSELAARTIIAVDRWYRGSKTCPACGQLAAKMPLTIREWTCAACGVCQGRRRRVRVA